MTDLVCDEPRCLWAIPPDRGVGDAWEAHARPGRMADGWTSRPATSYPSMGHDGRLRTADANSTIG